MLQRIAVSCFLLLASVHAGFPQTDSPQSEVCLQSWECGGVIFFDEDDVQEALTKRNALRTHLKEFPDDVQAINDLLANLDSIEVPREVDKGGPVDDLGESEISTLYRRLRELDPENRDGWCDDLDSPSTLAQAKSLASNDPSHWIVVECLAEHIGDSEPDVAKEMLDAFFAGRDLQSAVTDPSYELSDGIRSAIFQQQSLVEDVGPESILALIELAESSGHTDLRFEVASNIAFVFDESEPMLRWARNTLAELRVTDLDPWNSELLCEWWLDEDQPTRARICFEELLQSTQSRPSSQGEATSQEGEAGSRGFFAQRARSVLNGLDMEEDLLDAAVLRLEQGPSYGRMHLWQELFLHAGDEQDPVRVELCEHLNAAWLRGAFEDEVLADPDACPRRLDILVELMTDCGFEALLRERIDGTGADADPDEAPTRDPGASNESAGSPAASSADRAAG